MFDYVTRSVGTLRHAQSLHENIEKAIRHRRPEAARRAARLLLADTDDIIEHLPPPSATAEPAKVASARPIATVTRLHASPTATGPPEQRMKNLENFYKNTQKWSAGPHLFVADDLIWVFTPLTVSGVHSPSWNSVAWGVEMVGDFNAEPFDARVRDNAVAALASLHAVLGLDPKTLKLHKEDKKTTHDCPGKNVVKQDIIDRITAEIDARHGGDHAPSAGA